VKMPLKGCSLILLLTDPWELGEQIDWKPIIGLTVESGLRQQSTFGPASESIIIKLNNPFYFNGLYYEFLQGSPRYDHDSFDMLRAGKSIVCNFICVLSKQVNSNSPFDLSWWRGGGGLTASMELLKDNKN